MSLTKYKDLKHIPGTTGWPIFGEYFKMSGDKMQAYLKQKRAKYGDLFVSKGFFHPHLTICGKEAVKFLLVEQNKFTESKEAWSGRCSEARSRPRRDSPRPCRRVELRHKTSGQ